MKRTIFTITAVSLPLLLLVAVELVLRLANYGGDLSAVAVAEHEGRSYFTMNQRVGTRFFGADRLYYQKGARDFFEVEKRPNTLRIFLLGASTTAGFPYEYQATPAWLLHDRLAAAFPEKNIEVVNTAISATNSFAVRELVKELVHYDPDLFIAYMGQNEFYGVYGVGSTHGFGGQPWLVDLYLWLQRFKTTLALRDLIFSIMGAPGASVADAGGSGSTVMEQMTGRAIRHDDVAYEAAVQAFAENNADIIRIARRHGVPVLLSTLVANEKDLEPFVSFHRSDLADSQRTAWEVQFEAGVRAEREGAYATAIGHYAQALAIDSLPARLHFRLGKAYEAAGDGPRARAAFIRARDLDGLRFRAPSEFNAVIRTVADRFGTPVADVEETFRSQSPYGSLGNEWLWEHVHPNIEGYFLLAKAWFSAIKHHRLLVPEDAWARAAEPPDSLLWQNAAISPVDRAIAKVKIAKLMNRPPFKPAGSDADFLPQTLAEQVALEYVEGKNGLSWGKAHLTAAQTNRQNGQLREALVEYRAMSKVEGGRPITQGLMGDVLVDLGAYDEADSLLAKALTAGENPYLRYRLGVVKLMTNRPVQAIEFIQQSLQTMQLGGAQLTPMQLADVNYHLALANAKAGRTEAARAILQSVLRLNPDDRRAVALLSELT